MSSDDLKQKGISEIHKYLDHFNSLKYFYEKTRDTYIDEKFNPGSGDIYVAISDTDTTSIAGIILPESLKMRKYFKAKYTSELLEILNNAMPILFCNYWEGLINHINNHFYNGKKEIKSYLNPDIIEMILIRDCLVHKGGIADENYFNNPIITSSPEGKFTKYAKISLEPYHIEKFYKSVTEGYEQLRLRLIEEIEATD